MEVRRGGDGRGATPTGGGWKTTKARGTVELGAPSCTPSRTVPLGELGLLEPGTTLFSLLGPRSLFRSQNCLGMLEELVAARKSRDPTRTLKRMKTILPSEKCTNKLHTQSYHGKETLF